jgi:hypothetical protein
MLTQHLRLAALTLASSGLTIATPAAAVPASHSGMAVSLHGGAVHAYDDDDDDDDDDRRRWDRGDRYERHGRYGRHARYDRRYPQRSAYGEPVYRNTSVWRGEDGRYYCRKSNGTTGLLIGGAAGALLGREIAGRGDRTLGAILGAAGGALLGRSIDSKTVCR